jgi:hypothetical protein
MKKRFGRNELMKNGATEETVRNLEALVASLTELLDVQEKVVGEQSERLKRDEEALNESNDRFLAFINEAAMRLKIPLEIVEENLAILISDIERGDFESTNISLVLKIQINNIKQIRKNIFELNKAIVDRTGEISDASKKFLTK